MKPHTLFQSEGSRHYAELNTQNNQVNFSLTKECGDEWIDLVRFSGTVEEFRTFAKDRHDVKVALNALSR